MTQLSRKLCAFCNSNIRVITVTNLQEASSNIRISKVVKDKVSNNLDYAIEKVRNEKIFQGIEKYEVKVTRHFLKCLCEETSVFENLLEHVETRAVTL